MWFLFVIFTLLIAITLHAIMCRIKLPLGVVAKFLCVGFLCGLVLIKELIDQYGIRGYEVIGALLTYSFLCELYIFFFTMVLTSISSNLLIKLDKKGMSSRQLEKFYNTQHMVEIRLDRLINAQFLEEEKEIKIAQKGKKIVATFHLLRKFFRHEK